MSFEYSESKNHQQLQSFSKKSNKKPQINIPQPKRIQKQGTKLSSYSKSHISNKPKKQKSISKEQLNILQLQISIISNSNQKQIASICSILSYVMGEFEYSFQSGARKLAKPCGIFTEWEGQQLSKQLKDTNLGDFIIKMPNPDNLSEQFLKKHNLNSDNLDRKIDIQEAFLYYNDMFQVETNTSISLIEQEKIAFMIGFYLLPTEKNYFEQEEELYSIAFLKLYYYYLQIKKKSYSEYVKVKKENKYIKQYETDISKDNQQFLGKLLLIDDAKQRQIKFNQFKEKILSYLKKEILVRNQLNSGKVQLILQQVLQISTLLKTFPQLIKKILSEINKIPILRRFVKGGTLRRMVYGEEVMWVGSTGNPKDLCTLLRAFILYRITRRCCMFVRTFLTYNQEHFMLVIKSSEQVMQLHAQTIKMNSEIELGSTDLFSFEPVDHYLRPLRMHEYIRDRQFIKKYELDNNKQDKDQNGQQRSIQGEAINFFKKAQKMNDDELRAKIILEQQDADRAYQWISKKLSIGYVNEENILNNSDNRRKPTRQTWELYYVYSKMIVEFTQRIKIILSSQDKESQGYRQEISKNLGMIFRMMFLKALYMCNWMHLQHRQSRNFIPRIIENWFKDAKKLRTIWDHMQINDPTGYYPYINTKKLQRIWRKYEVNEMKSRSKFFPSQRLIITNRIILQNFNIGKALTEMHIDDYYPLHDPFILKNIRLQPYLKTVNKKLNDLEQSQLTSNIYAQYQCPYTNSDFNKACVEQKLSFKLTTYKNFSVETVRYYCGQKIAYYFQFIRFLSQKAMPIVLPAFLIQILLWSEQQHILSQGSSFLTQFNNALIFIMTVINMLWTTHVIQRWKQHERTLAQKFGVTHIDQQNHKRVKFIGQFVRNFITDQMNQEKINPVSSLIKSLFTLCINSLYVILVGLVITSLFVVKSYLYQLGLNQTLVNIVPAILISLAVQLFNFLYLKLIRVIIDFQNHKTVAEYQSSLISKAYLVTFLLTFYAIFLYGFFSSYLDSEFLCRIRTSTTNLQINNCDYFVSSQLLSFVLLDLLFTIIGAFLPLVMFKVREFLRNREAVSSTRFCVNNFEKIDEFYEQEDYMQTYMFNEQIDNSWIGFINLTNVFTATALFGPALPLMYVMMFVTGVIRLHAGKYQIIFLTKRALPIKANSINWWLVILEAISIMSIVCNIAYMIFTRKVVAQNKPQTFFFLLVIFLILKYYLRGRYIANEGKMANRNTQKTLALLMGKADNKTKNYPMTLNTDIENVIYNQEKLKRKLPVIKKANVKAKKY